MEENRLRPMVENYNQAIFNELFERTAPLRKKLAGQIDHKRFGVDYDEVLSWFSIKFIFVFNKHHNLDPDILLGYLINSLQNYKNRILRKAYTIKYSQSIVSLEPGITVDEDELPYEETELEDSRDQKFSLLTSYLKKIISDNALTLLEITLNPPPYILNRMNEEGYSKIQKIPDHLLAEYLGLGCEKGLKYILALKRELKEGINSAKIYFKAS